MYRALIDLAEADARRLADAIADVEELGFPPAAAVELGPGRWQAEITFFEAPDEAALRRYVYDLLGHQADQKIEQLPEVDWVAESLKGLAPVSAGRFFVHGSHDRHRVPPGRVALEIEAAEAFGTGHHGTTAGCLEAIDRLLKKRQFFRPLDLGTGTGVLAFALAKAQRVPVLATDNDPVATRTCRRNAVNNGVRTLIRAETAEGFDHPAIRTRAPFDLIVANILAGPLVALAGPLTANLAAGGGVVLSGLLREQEARVAAAYANRGLRLDFRVRKGEWSVLVFRRGR